MAYRSTNPCTGEIVSEFNNMNNKGVESKLQKAQEAYKSWSKTSFEERAAIMKRAAQLMAGNVVVLKHASNCPQCVLAMEKLYKDAGSGVFSLIHSSSLTPGSVSSSPLIGRR